MMMSHPIRRAYADTSVFGGVFDEEFHETSEAFFELVRAGRFVLLVSDIVRREIELAPAPVKDYFSSLLAYMQLVPFDAKVLALRDAYVTTGIVGPQWSDDAGHVAAASVAGADLIVSWNFRHIVHFDKIRLYNAVNALYFYHPLEIRSPAEVIDYEDEDA
ncbi:MAG TPA: hypothetical protein VMV94_13170 [Phycisphaerae bacterium]|nr:hypothetical protein [Phycisphaerae bacterium]